MPITLTLYELVQAIQILSVCVCSVFVVIMVRQKSNRISKWMLLAAIAAFMQNAGYLQELWAKDAGEVIVAIRFEYFGGAFASTFLLLFVLSFYGHKKPRWIFSIIFFIDIFVVFSVWTCDWNSLYYTSVAFETESLIPHVLLGKGPLYLLYVPVVCMQLFACILVAASHCFHVYNKSQKRISQMILGSTLAPALFYLIAALYGFRIYDIVPLGVTISVLINVMATVSQRMFNLEVNAHENIIETMDEAIIIVDHMYGFVEANRQACRLFPVLERCSRNKNIKELGLDSGIFEQTENDITRDGRTYHIHTNEIRGEKQLEGYVIMLFDITDEHRQMERMQQLKIEADKANSAKSDFLARMSHEIRTPINAVLGMDEMILRESREPEICGYARNIQTSAQMLLQIINDILDFSKIETGKMEIVPVNYKLAELLADVSNIISIKASQKQLDFEIKVSPQLPAELIGDDLRMRQILLNLLTNGVKYTSMGKVTLEVDGRTEGEQAELVFQVKDTGIGMREEEIPRLFEAFERIDQEHNRGIEGTGLGLNICAQMLKLMGSRLLVESVYGKGSTFSFKLTQKVADFTPVGSMEEHLKKTGKTTVHQPVFTAPWARILMVDDNKLNGKVFVSLLKDTKMQIDVLDSGQECLERIKTTHYDLIFLDHMMPEMDGVETLHEMKRMKENACADTPVIMLTANALTGAGEQYIQEGFDDFLSKPVIPDHLELMICKHLPPKYVVREGDTAQSMEAGDEEEKLSRIQGIDLEYAKVHLPDARLLWETVRNFYWAIDPERQKLQELMEHMDEQQTPETYRIQVHALKGTAALIGELSVMALAKLCEEAAAKEDRERIRRLHPLLMEELDRCKTQLQLLEESTVKKEEAKLPEVLPLLYMLQESLKDRDFTGADILMEKLESYRYESHIYEKIELLHTQLAGLLAQDGIATVQQLMDEMKGGDYEQP